MHHENTRTNIYFFVRSTEQILFTNDKELCIYKLALAQCIQQTSESLLDSSPYDTNLHSM